jgi:hypothetical protein
LKRTKKKTLVCLFTVFGTRQLSFSVVKKKIKMSEEVLFWTRFNNAVAGFCREAVTDHGKVSGLFRLIAGDGEIASFLARCALVNFFS